MIHKKFLLRYITEKLEKIESRSKDFKNNKEWQKLKRMETQIYASMQDENEK